MSTSTIDGNNVQLKNRFTDDLQTIDDQQIVLQNRINELEMALTIANETQQKRHSNYFNGEQRCHELNEKVKLFHTIANRFCSIYFHTK